MSHTVHIGDRSPVVLTDYGTPGNPTTRTYTADDDGNVQVTSRAEGERLMAYVPTARYVDPTPAENAGDSSSDSPSTPSGRAGRGKS